MPNIVIPKSSPRHQVGFIGVGAMGTPMIQALVDSGILVVAMDLSQDNRAAAERIGAKVTTLASDLKSCSTVICMLPSSPIVEDVVLHPDHGLLQWLPVGAAVIDMGSSRPQSTHYLGEQLSEAGITFLDAPVSGGVAGAVSRRLSVMVGATDQIFERFRLLLETFGTAIHVGPLGSGHAMKALNNLMSAAALTVATEALQVGLHYGISGVKLLEVVNQSTGRSNATETKIGQQVLSGAFNSGFRLRLMLKDLTTAIEMADAAGVSTPLAAACTEIWKHGAAVLPEDADQTEIGRLPMSEM